MKAKNSFFIIGGKEISRRWFNVIQTGSFNVIDTALCWSITSINHETIISFSSSDEMKQWMSELIEWKHKSKTKISRFCAGKKGARVRLKLKRTKNSVSKDFIVTDEYRRMKGDPDLWREQS